jgi:hypothetical protein
MPVVPGGDSGDISETGYAGGRIESSMNARERHGEESDVLGYHLNGVYPGRVPGRFENRY